MIEHIFNNYLTSIRKRHLSPDSRVGRSIEIPETYPAFLRFQLTGRPEPERNPPFQD